MVLKLTEKSTVFQPEKILDISLSNCDIACTFTSSLSIPMTTISEIAHRARVSIGTVDRVIHNRGRVAKKTEEKIKKIIKELDFKPNIYARNLKLKKHILSEFCCPYRIRTANTGNSRCSELTKHNMNSPDIRSLSSFSIMTNIPNRH